MVSSPSLYGKQMGGKCKQWQILFSGAPKSLQMVTVTMKLKDISPWKKSYDRPKQHIKKQRHHADNKCPYSQSCSFSSSYVWMWELDHKDGWTPKNWCFWTVVLEKTLHSPLDCKKIHPVNPKPSQPWILIGGTDAKAEAPIHWPLGVKSQLTGKTLMLEKIEGKRRRKRQRMRWLDGIKDLMDMNLGKHPEMLRGREAQCTACNGVTKSDMTCWLNNNKDVINQTSGQPKKKPWSHP